MINNSITNEFRLNYYLNELKDEEIIINKNNYTFEYNYSDYSKIIVLNKDYLNKNEGYNNYTKDLVGYFKLINNNNFFLALLNDSIDHNLKVPVIAKARSVCNTNRILLKLNNLTHSFMLKDIPKYDIAFTSKNNKLIWRGCSTNKRNGLRETLVKKFQNHINPDIDIKYDKLVQGYNNDKNQFIIGNRLSYSDHLKSKFILSIEGNDVATNLKWLLLSNSVVLMPTPTVCSWFMEDQLKPFVHYIPIKSDFSDLEEKYKWCLDNLGTCETIAKNATKYIEIFLDEKNENELIQKVIENYFKKVKIISN